MNRNLFTAIMLVLLSVGLAFSQVPAEQDTIEIPPGIENIGLIEATIEGDADENGNRINPQRVYKLLHGAHYIQSQIDFGGDDIEDTTSTLIIVGEVVDGNLPMVLTQPLDDVRTFRHQVHGSLTLKNLYWPCKALNNTANGIFGLNRANQRLIMENMVIENTHRGDVVSLRNVTQSVDIYIKNVYYRDLSQLANSWNFVMFARGDGLPVDTLWIENTTVSNGGMPVFGKSCPTNFFFFNHNTIINTSKYPIWFERNKESYITNNLFINANYEGECRSTWETQLFDGVRSGVVLQDTITPDMWPGGAGPTMDEVKFLAANNVKFDSPLLDNYWAGAYNDVADWPISNRQWGTVDTTDLPLRVYPTPWLGERELDLIARYPGVVAVDNHDGVDPQLVTPSIANQAAADLLARQMRKNYQVAAADGSEDLTDEDRVNLWFGDGDGTTIPGNGVEDSPTGFTNVNDLPEDFAYTADITSTIDGNHLGDLTWFPAERASYDGMAALAAVKAYYNSATALEKLDAVPGDYKLSQNYPNPFNPTTKINFTIPTSSDVKLTVFDALGREVELLVNERMNAGNYQATWNAINYAAGIYFYTIETKDFSATKKMLLIK